MKRKKRKIRSVSGKNPVDLRTWVMAVRGSSYCFTHLYKFDMLYF